MDTREPATVIESEAGIGLLDDTLPAASAPSRYEPHQVTATHGAHSLSGTASPRAVAPRVAEPRDDPNGTSKMPEPRAPRHRWSLWLIGLVALVVLFGVPGRLNQPVEPSVQQPSRIDRPAIPGVNWVGSASIIDHAAALDDHDALPPRNCWHALSQLPIQYHGRIQPLGRYAQHALKAMAVAPQADHAAAVQALMALIAEAESPAVDVAPAPSYGARRVQQRVLTVLKEQDLHVVPPPPESSGGWRSILLPDGYAWEQQVALKQTWSLLLEALRANDHARVDVTGRRLASMLTDLQPPGLRTTRLQ